MEKKKMVYICEDTFDGIMSGVYKAWEIKHDTDISLHAGNISQQEMFVEYVDIDTDFDLSQKVIRTIKREFTSYVYFGVYRAAMSCQSDKADAIFRFLIDAFRVGRGITECLAIDSVKRMFEIDRFVKNEAHYHLEFIRFSKLANSVLYAEITPKSNVITLIEPHFSDRLSGENWMIYDKNRQFAALHKANCGSVFVSGEDINMEEIRKKDVRESEIENLWKCFFQTITIESRRNYCLQRNNLPIRYRKNMLEFEK